MIGGSVSLRERLGEWMAGVGRALRGKAEEAEDEIRRVDRPEPRDEAEEALWQAMGWSEDERESAVEVATRKAMEGLGGKR